jgi:hypothetical protein
LYPKRKWLVVARSHHLSLWLSGQRWSGTTLSKTVSSQQLEQPPSSPGCAQATGNGFTHLPGGAEHLAFRKRQPTHFAGRSPHPLLTTKVTKKLDGGSGRFRLGFGGFAVDENCAVGYGFVKE